MKPPTCTPPPVSILIPKLTMFTIKTGITLLIKLTAKKPIHVFPKYKVIYAYIPLTSPSRVGHELTVCW